MDHRIDVFEQHYTWVDSDGLRYFRERLDQAERDATYALDLVLGRCDRLDQQQRCLDALQFKCDLLNTLLDHLDYHAHKQGWVQDG